MATKTKSENRQPTFSLEELNRIVGEQTLIALAKQREEFEASMLAANKSAKDKIDYEALTVRAFKKAYGIIVKPRTDVRTYNLWLQAGFKVKPGEKATAVKQLRLFHVSQVVEMTKAEKAEALAKLAEKSAARTADKLPAVSPISAPVAPVKTSKAKGRKIIPISEITTAG